MGSLKEAPRIDARMTIIEGGRKDLMEWIELLIERGWGGGGGEGDKTKTPISDSGSEINTFWVIVLGMVVWI